MKKVYITEFRVGDTIYEGPFIYANTFEEADLEAEAYGVVIVGEAKIVIGINETEEQKRVLH